VTEEINFYKETDFQDSSIGRIPRDWNIRELGDKSTAGIIAGQSPPSSTYNKENRGLPFLQGKMEFGEMFPSPTTYCSEPIKVARKDDVLLSVRAPVGDVNIAPFECCIGRGLAAIRPKVDKLDHLFLFYFLKLEGKRFEALSTGSTFKAIRIQEIEKFSIPLPSAKEQKGIVRVLGVVDLAVAKAGEVIVKTERLKKGLMQELLTRGIRHKEHKFTKEVGYKIPIDWKVKAAKELFYIKGRIGWRGLKKAHFTNEGPYLITGVDFAEGRIKWKNCFHIPMNKFLESPEIFVQKDDILVTKDGTIGKVAFVDDVPSGKASINAHLLLVRNLKNDDVHPMYTYYALQTSHFQNYAKLRQVGTTRAGLTQRAFEQFQFILPPLEEQRKILSVLSTIDNEIRLEKNEKTRLERVKRSLMDLLLTGKVRIKVD
jgi:type I restriction enzyme S subunit